jgi:hypothetical protein
VGTTSTARNNVVYRALAAYVITTIATTSTVTSYYSTGGKWNTTSTGNVDITPKTHYARKIKFEILGVNNLAGINNNVGCLVQDHQQSASSVSDVDWLPIGIQDQTAHRPSFLVGVVRFALTN